MKKIGFVLIGSLSLLLIMAALTGTPRRSGEPSLSPAVPASSPRIDADFGRIPLHFIPNEGQVEGPAAFYVQGRDKTIYFTSEGLTFVLNGKRKSEAERLEGDSGLEREWKPRMFGVGGPRETSTQEDGFFAVPRQKKGTSAPDLPSERWVVKLDFADANPDVIPASIEESGAVISYFKGRPEDWKTGLSASSRIVYRELWPGIDLHYYGTVDRMKYEFIVHPGADPSRIKLAYQGAESVVLTGDDRLEVMTPVGGFQDDVPVAWQDVEGVHTDVAVAYFMEAKEPRAENGAQVYGFEVGKYDESLTLILDPAVLVYCGYIGGSNSDSGNCIAVDYSGNAYITGSTSSDQASFPVVAGPDLTHNGSIDAFVAKVNASGTALVYCGYIGGSNEDSGYGIAVDGSGNAYITGSTSSDQASFPVVTGPDLTYNGYGDAFVAKVNASGTALVYCGYIGGSNEDSGYGIAVDGSGNAYITGNTYSDQASFPVVAGPDLTHNGSIDAFVAKVNASGTALVYCGYLGGSNSDSSNGIAVDGSGNAYITGSTSSDQASFPVITGPDLTNSGSVDAFVAKVNASGTELVYCGYIGGSSFEYGNGIAVDGSGNAYITGYTASDQASFPVVAGPDLTHNGSRDAFVAKVNASGTALVYCGYIGGSSFDEGNGIAVDGSGNAYITGYTASDQASFPVVTGPDLTYNGSGDAFVAKVNASGTALVYCGYIGGSGDDYGKGIALDGSGNAFITGYSASDEASFPVVTGPYLTHKGYSDAFVAKIISNLVAATIKSPASGATVSGIVPIQVDAFDQDGISKVETYINDMLKITDTTYPYSYNWNTAGLLGAYIIKARAYNLSNQYAETQINVTVTAEIPPTITIHPASQIVESGQTASLSVEATGATPLSYQWYQGATGNTSNPIGGATSSSYTTPVLTASASYWVRVSNTYGNASSDTAVITIGLPSKLVGTVLDQATAAVIPGATIKLGDYPQVTTDADGRYEIPNLGQGDYSLEITRSGYNTFTGMVGISISGTITRNFTLTPAAAGDIAIYSLTSKYGGFVYYLDGVDFIVTYTAHINWGAHPPGKVRFITPYGQHEVTATGDAVSRDFNMSAEFDPCTTLKAVAISSNGSQSQIASADFTMMPMFLPGILFNKYDRGDSFSYQSKWSEFELINEELQGDAIPKSIPVFGGKGFNLETLLAVDITAGSRGNIAIDLDISPKNEPIVEKKWTKGQLAGIEFSLAPKLNISGQYAFPGCSYSWSGYLGLNGKVRLEKSVPFVVSVVPWPLYAKISLEMSADLSLGVADINPVRLNGQFSLDPYVRGSLGAGIDNLFAIEGWVGGGAEFCFQYPEAPHLYDATVYLNAGFTAYALFFKREWELLSWDWSLMESAAQTAVPSQTTPATPKLLERDYLRNPDAGRFVRERDTKLRIATPDIGLPKISSTLLQESVIPYFDPCLSSTGGLVGLVWLQDDPERLAVNRTVAMFSTNDGTDWSEPLRIGDDGTADFHPQLMMFGDGSAIATWEDEKFVHPDTATFEDMVANLEISASVFDPSSGAWQTLERMTNNDYLDRSPLSSGASPTNVMLTWIANEANDTSGSASAPNKLWYSVYNGTAWSAPQVAAEIPMAALKYSLVYNGSAGHVVLSLDTDGDPATIADIELYRLTYSGGAWGALTRMTTDSLPDVNPKLALGPGGDIVLVWLKGNELLCSLNFGAPAVVFTDEFSTNLADFKLANSEGGKLAVVWSKPAEYNSDLFVLFYEPAYESWGAAPSQITFDPEVEKSVTVAFRGENDLVAVYDRTPVETEPLTRMAASGELVTFDVPRYGFTDIYVLEYSLGRDLALGAASLRISPPNPEPGAGATLTVTARNTGDETAVGVPVAFYLGDPSSGGTQIGEASVPGNLVPGAAADVSILWEVPETTSPLTIFAVVDPESAFDTDNRGDNTVSLEIVKADLMTSGVTWDWIGANKVLITARVLNSGVITSAPTSVKFRQDSSQGALISEQTLPALTKGEFRDVTIEWNIAEPSPLGHPVHIVIDEENLVPEFDEANNEKAATITLATIEESLIVLAPNGGETWPAKSIQKIQWATSGIVGNVRIEFSTDDGVTFAPIIDSTPNTGSYDWTVENFGSSTCLVRVSETDGFPVDTSDAVFTIVEVPEIVVTSPNGGERWIRGSTYDITWASVDITGEVTIDLYRSGEHLRTLGSADVSTGTFSWTIPLNEIPGNDYRIVVRQEVLSDGSNEDFAIVSGVRVDFDRDGQEDLLWRYYGTGGRNRVWFLGNTNPGTQPLLLADAQMETDTLVNDRAPGSRRVLEGTEAVPIIPSPRGRLVVDDPREAVDPKDWIDGRALAAGRGRPGAAVPEMGAHSAGVSLSEPGQAMAGLDAGVSSAADMKIAATGVLGGADILSVSDLTWQVMGTGDFNNDGNTDVLWRYNGAGGRVRVWYMDGLNVTSGADIGSVSDLDWKIVGTGDFNRDGKVDLLWHHATSGRVRVWYLDGVSIIAGADISTVADLNWKIVGTGDFDNDGNVDILWRHGVSGRNRVWYMNGVSILSGADLLGVTDQNWQIAGTGDYNGDGHTDVLWRYNGPGGYVYIWYLNGTSWIGTEKLIAVPDLNWKIVSR